MSCVAAKPIRFAGGEELMQPFLVELGSSSEIVNLGDGVVTGEVWWHGEKHIDLSVVAGIEIENAFPVLNSDPQLQQPHGRWRLNEAQSAALPMGRVAVLRLKYVDAAGITVFTEWEHLERVQ